jgi:RimJ/RimL family protein N-acetyltransferase
MGFVYTTDLPEHKITFEKLRESHLPLIHNWLQNPHVKEFWKVNSQTVKEAEEYFLKNSKVHLWIAYLNDFPFAFLEQHLIGKDDSLSMWKSKSTLTYGMDLFIGEPKLLGQNLTSPLIKAFFINCFNKPCRILANPEEKNQQAIHIYKSLGFRSEGILQIADKRHQVLSLDLTS